MSKRCAAAAAIILMGLAACGPGPERPASRGGRFRVVATLFPLAEFAAAVAGEKAEVTVFLPPGADVHTWLPSFGDLRRLAEAELFIYVGEGLEPWVGDLLAGASRDKLRVLEAGRGLSHPEPRAAGAGPGRGEHGHEGPDPHIWLDLDLDRTLVDRIRDALAGIDPGGRSGYEANALAYEARLAALDARFRDGLKDCPVRTFVLAGHEAFGYLASRYGLEQIAVYGLSPDAAPTPRRLAEIAGTVRRRGLKTVFYEPGTGDKMARLIAAETGAEVRLLHPGHNLTPEERREKATFLDLMERNLENLRYGLGCR